MKKLTAIQHGYIDYLAVVLFLAAPSVLGLTGMAGTFAYVLAAIHLALTLLTAFPLSVYKLIPFEIHGWIERGVGPVLNPGAVRLRLYRRGKRILCRHGTRDYPGGLGDRLQAKWIN